VKTADLVTLLELTLYMTICLPAPPALAGMVDRR